jgi:hypothetical protein
MAVTTIAGAIVALRTQVRANAPASVDLKNRVTDALDRFQAELAALGFPTTSGTDNPSAVSLADALVGMRAQITAQTGLSAYARTTAITALDQLSAELRAHISVTEGFMV